MPHCCAFNCNNESKGLKNAEKDGKDVTHQSIPAAHIPLQGNCVEFARLVSPGAGGLPNLARPGCRALANPGGTPGLLHPRG